MKRGSWLTLFSLVLASGSIYALPYLRQTYHTTMLEAYQLTNTQVGGLQATFGLIALFCYLPGGKVADRFPARNLLSLSLLLTALGGGLLLLSTRWPLLIAVHAFWGVFTILTFWPALIKATRIWAGDENQGSAFGLLQGFTALVLAALTALGVAAFSQFGEPVAGLKAVVAVYTVANVVAAAAVWVFCPPDEEQSREVAATEQTGYWEVFKMPAVLLQSVVILTAYFASWGTADFAAYAEQAFGQSRVAGATLSSFSLWLNPPAAIAAGWLADRFGSSRVIRTGFLLSTVSLLSFALVPPGRVWFLWLQAGLVSLFIFAVMGVYYALLDEGGVPLEATGRAVGIISIIGYTPDVFAPLMHGWLLDTFPGSAGHRIFYLVLAAATLLGWVAARAYPSKKADYLPVVE